MMEGEGVVVFCRVRWHVYTMAHLFTRTISGRGGTRSRLTSRV